MAAEKTAWLVWQWPSFILPYPPADFCNRSKKCKEKCCFPFIFSCFQIEKCPRKRNVFEGFRVLRCYRRGKRFHNAGTQKNQTGEALYVIKPHEPPQKGTDGMQPQREGLHTPHPVRRRRGKPKTFALLNHHDKECKRTNPPLSQKASKQYRLP